MATERTERELWDALEALDDDPLDPDLPASMIDDQLRRAGAAPEVLASDGAALVAKLKDERRLAWQTRARERQRRFAERSLRRVPPGLGRDAILARLDGYRSDPRVGPDLAVHFRKRGPQESSDDELRELLEDIEALVATEDGDGE